MMNALPSIRKTYLIALSLVILLLVLAAYLQAYDGITPCPLCLLQRLMLVLLGCIFCLGTAFNLNKVGQFMTSQFACLIAGLGCVLAGRQVWLQHLPVSQKGDCGASLEYMLHMLPLHEIFKEVFAGSAECSRVEWQFLNLSLAEWSLFGFSVLLIISTCQFYRLLNKS